MNTKTDTGTWAIIRRSINLLIDSLPYVLDVLVWIALALLIVSSFTEFVQSDAFTDTAATFFSAIALVISLASVTFTYSMTKTNDEEARMELVSAGQMFFYALLIILITLLIGWFTFRVDAVTSHYAWGRYIKVLLGIILLLSQFSLIVAATNLSRGIRILGRSLSEGRVTTFIGRRSRKR